MKCLHWLFCFLFASTLSAQTAVINEFSSDPSMYDGLGGEFIELYCPAGGGACDISCWVVSDAQGIVTIPDGTIIPDGGYYLIAHVPSFSCDSCDFFGIPVDLDMATCGCLNGGSYGVGIDGSPTIILGQGGNQGEMVLLYNNLGALQEGWTFDNASATTAPNGAIIGGTAVGTCPAQSITTPDTANAALTNIGGIHLGCNTSFLRTTDGGAIWGENDHPTPGASNANRGDNAYDYQYQIDGGAWITIPKNSGANIDAFADTICAGDSIAFRIIIENYQHANLSTFDSSGRYGSYFHSPTLGMMDWPTIGGLGAARGDTLVLQSNKEALTINENNFYRLQWSDYKDDGPGSFSPTSSNECYERMNFTLRRNETIDSAVVNCVDALSGLTSTTVYPITVDGLGVDVYFELYDDIGDQSNLVDINQSGLFSLTPADAPTVGYYVIVRNQCNEVIARNAGAFCLAVPPCPQITTSAFVKNGVTCGENVVIIHQESFEGAPNVGYSSTGVFSDGTSDYFDLIGFGIDPTGAVGLNNPDGTQFWQAEDTDDAGNPNASGISDITISNINITGFASIDILGLFAASASLQFDPSDHIHIYADVDGGGEVLIGAFESENATTSNTRLALDTDLDGVGDGAQLDRDFTDYVFPLGTTGTSLDIRIEAYFEFGNTDAGFDNIRVRGAVPGNCQACPNDTLTFSVDGTNLPLGGRIDWYYNTSTNFDPYNGEGTYIGFTPLPTVTDCSSPTVVLNEVDYRPSTNNGANPDAGDRIELLAPPGTDLSCYVLTDGDWTITFPAGSIVPADGLFTIGNDNVHGVGSFDLDGENCGCFTDGAGGDGLLILSDAGEYVALFDGTGAFVQGMIYGSPTAANTPPNGSFSTAGVISTIGAAGCPASVTIPGAGSFSNAPGGVPTGTSLIRSPDATGPWTTQVGGSMNACNLGVTVLAPPTFDYVIPQDACNEVRHYKGIINPHPNTAACPNSDPTAFTDEFTIEVQCPTANLEGVYEECATAAPITLPVSVSGITTPAGVTFIYSNNGANDTIITTVINDTISFDVNTTGIYDGILIIPDSGCATTVDSFAIVNLIPMPGNPAIPDPILVCEGDTALIAASGASTYQWSFVDDFSAIESTGSDFMVAAPDVVYIQSINQNDSATVSCFGGIDSTRLNTQICNVILLATDLVTFDAKRVGDATQLDWHWNATIDNQYFEIERSANAINFAPIKQISQIANPQQIEQQYQILDEIPLTGWNYYRLKYPTNNGMAYSQIRAIWFGEIDLPIHVYPTPTRGGLQIDFAEALELNAPLVIYDMLGKVVYAHSLEKGGQHYQINLEELPAAVYIMTINVGGLSKTIKVIKE